MKRRQPAAEINNIVRRVVGYEIGKASIYYYLPTTAPNCLENIVPTLFGKREVMGCVKDAPDIREALLLLLLLLLLIASSA